MAPFTVHELQLLRHLLARAGDAELFAGDLPKELGVTRGKGKGRIRAVVKSALGKVRAALRGCRERCGKRAG